MQFRKRRGQLLATVGLLAIVVGLLAAAGAVRTQAPSGVRPPPFRMESLKTYTDTVGAVVAYGRDTAALQFDTVGGAGDDQLLHTGTCPGTSCGHGPRSVIQPWKGAYELDSGGDWLAQGRIIARIITRDAASYPKYGIHGRDTVFWWVGRRGGDTVSVFTSTRGGRPVVKRLHIDGHPGYTWHQSISRWLWDPADEQTWTTCGSSGCCRS